MNTSKIFQYLDHISNFSFSGVYCPFVKGQIIRKILFMAYYPFSEFEDHAIVFVSANNSFKKPLTQIANQKRLQWYGS